MNPITTNCSCRRRREPTVTASYGLPKMDLSASSEEELRARLAALNAWIADSTRRTHIRHHRR
jgi:hypothetical protein